VIDVALLSIIRRWHLRDQIPLREIARRLGISRNTVRRYLRSETTEPSYAERRSSSVLDKYSVQLSAWLKAEASKPRKQRRNLKQIHLDLKELGYEGSYDRVAAFARQWKVGQLEWVNSASKRTTTIIAAMAADSAPDSSQALVQLLKTKLQVLQWDGAKIVNTFGAAYKASKDSGFTRLDIVLIDEFVGSGRTVLSRVSEINRTFARASQTPCIKVRAVFASVVGRDRLIDSGLDFECVDQVKRGISDFHSKDESDKKIGIMLDIEGRLSSVCNELKLADYSLGYGKTECLISLANTNIPNNVFPIFWWPRYIDGALRSPLFVRWMGN